MASAITTPHLASSRCVPMRSSKRPIASCARSIIRTAIPDDKGSEDKSRKRRKRTKSSPTRKRAPTTSSGTPSSIPSAGFGAAGAQASAAVRMASAVLPTPSVTSSAKFRRPGRCPRRGAASSAARPSLQSRASLEEAARGTEAKIPFRRWSECGDVSWQRRQPERSPKPVRRATVAGSARLAGFFSIQQTCPQCHGSGKIVPEPCGPQRRGPHQKEQNLSVKIPAESIVTIARSRVKARQIERGPSRRPLCGREPEGASGLPAREQRSSLRDADRFCVTAAMAAISRFQRWMATPRSRSCRDANRSCFRLRGKRHQGRTQQRYGDLVLPCRDRDAGEADLAAEGDLARVRGDQRAGSERAQPAREELVRQGTRIL